MRKVMLLKPKNHQQKGCTTRRRRFLSNIAISIISIFVSFGIAEIILRTGILDYPDVKNPSWIPVKFKKIDKKINQQNWEVANKNIFKFTDKFREVIKPKEIFRIAVLGDSFIWGDGLPYLKVWSHQLEEKFKGRTKFIEVLSWGKNGWSTKDEFNFLKNNGIKYTPDILLISFCTNDPDLNDFPLLHFRPHRSPYLAPFRYLFPNVLDFTGENLIGIINKWNKNWGYANWKDRLYKPENLSAYSNLLREIADFTRQNSIKLYFVFVPNGHDIYFEKVYKKVKPLLEQNQINYIDTYPTIIKNLGNIPTRQLWANPANAHPDEKINFEVTEVVYKHLIKNEQAIYDLVKKGQ